MKEFGYARMTISKMELHKLFQRNHKHFPRPTINSSFVADDLLNMESAPNYNKWLFSHVQPFLGDTVIEVGSGIGNMTRHILSSSSSVICIEPNPHCAAYLEHTFIGHPGFRLLSTSVEAISADSFVDLKVDNVVCINVLEHIEDDRAAMTKFANFIIGCNSSIIILVPAVPLALGPIDCAVGHFRRYSKGSLKGLILSAGLEISTMYYVNFLGLFGWIINSKIRNIAQQSRTQIKYFDAITPYLERFERRIHPPIGLSLFAVARRTQ